jgi:hypothetical protein
MPGLAVADAGFGVANLATVAALVSVLAVISVPTISASRDGYELATASGNVRATIEEARVNALKRNRHTWVQVTPATRTVRVQTAGGPGPEHVDTAETLPPRVTIINPGGPQGFEFDALGRPVTAAGIPTSHVIQLRHTGIGLVRTVTVATTGRVTVD